MSNAWLAHHGIVGMKWGIRRFQNKDGSLTPAGRKRYLNSDGSLNRRGEDDPEEVMLAVEDSKRYEKSQNKLKKEHKPDFSKMSYKEEKKYAKEQSVKMLKDFRKIYDDYMNYHGDDDDAEYEKFYSKYNTLCKDFEKQTGYEIIGHSSGSHNSIQFGRKTNNGYQEWIIHEDDYEPDGYWLEDPDKDW